MTTNSTEALDGGWGWLVVVSAFIAYAIIDGCSYSFGVLLPSLLEEFEESRSKTVIIGAVLNSTPLLCGPIASLVSNRIGIRASVMTSGLIISSGIISSAFVNSISGMIITYGLISGFGISFLFLNSIVVVTLYFEKKRALARGIAECGAGVGTLVMAPLYEYLIYNYNWRTAVIIIGSISLNLIVCGCVFKPLPLKSDEINCNRTEASNTKTFEAKMSVICFKENEIQQYSHVKRECTDEDMQKTDTGKDLNGNGERKELKFKDKQIKCNQEKENRRSIVISDISRFCSVNIGLLKSKYFIVLLVSTATVYFWYDIPYVFTVDRSLLLGYSKRMSTLIIAIIGITLWSMQLFTEYVAISVFGGLYGLLSASPEALTSVLIADISGDEKFNNAYGIAMFFQGVANLVGPPVAGKICL